MHLHLIQILKLKFKDLLMFSNFSLMRQAQSILTILQIFVLNFLRFIESTNINFREFACNNLQYHPPQVRRQMYEAKYGMQVLPPGSGAQILQRQVQKQDKSPTQGVGNYPPTQMIRWIIRNIALKFCNGGMNIR